VNGGGEKKWRVARVEGLNTSWIIGLGYCEKASLFLRGGFGIWDCVAGGTGV